MSSSFSRLRCCDGCQLVVEDDQIVAKHFPLGLDLFQLALADIGAGNWMAHLLGDRPDDLDIDRLGQPRQLLQ